MRTTGCTLLDVDPGRSTNRTVYTFVGEPEAVVEGALAAARVAHARIDMRSHRGEHARMGALDVCPFVPVSGVTMDDCVACAREFGRRAAEELGIPVYLYEEAAAAGPPTDAEPDPRRRIRRARGEDRAAGVAARLRTRHLPAGLGRDRHRGAQFPDRLQREPAGHEGAGAPHRPRPARAGPRSAAAGPAARGQGRRLVGGRVPDGPGVDEPRRLHRHSPARGLRGRRAKRRARSSWR